MLMPELGNHLVDKWVGVTLVTVKIDCHVHRRVVAGLTSGDADDLLGEPALIPLRVHP